MQMERAHVLDVMRRVGMHERMAEARRILPDPVDTDRDVQLLQGLGISRDSLIQRMGGSP